MAAKLIGLLLLSRRRRTYTRVPKTDLGTWVFVCSRNADFLVFSLTEMERFTDVLDATIGHSCALDSLRCVGGHWSRPKTFDRSKLDFGGGTELQISFGDIFCVF